MLRKTLAGLLAGAFALTCSAPAQAQAHYTGRVIMVVLPFCPSGTLEANGALVPVNDYGALFQLYGTTYGGDGVERFALPDLRGRVPVGAGQRPGAASYARGQQGGSETLQLTVQNLPPHDHVGAARAVNARGTLRNPRRAVPGDFPPGQYVYNKSNAPNVSMAVGGSTLPEPDYPPIAGRSPYLAIRYCVVARGEWPQ